MSHALISGTVSGHLTIFWCLWWIGDEEYFWPKGSLGLPVIFVSYKPSLEKDYKGVWDSGPSKKLFHYLQSVRLKKCRVTGVRIHSWDPFSYYAPIKKIQDDNRYKKKLHQHFSTQSCSFSLPCFVRAKSVCLINHLGDTCSSGVEERSYLTHLEDWRIQEKRT